MFFQRFNELHAPGHIVRALCFGVTVSGKRPVVAFFDIDGTLVWQGNARKRKDDSYMRPSVPSARVVRSLASFAKNGNCAFVCSGRPIWSIAPELRTFPFSGVISLAGAQVWIGDDLIRDERIPSHAVIGAARVFLDRGVSAFFESPKKSVELNATESNGGTGAVGPVARSIDDLQSFVPSLDYRKIVCASSDLERLGPGLRSLSAVFSVHNIMNGYHEMTVPSNNKAAGIGAVLDGLRERGTRPGPTIGFGDSENDTPMFEAVDISVAMGNAPTSIRSVASFVAPPVWEDGVAAVLDLIAGRGIEAISKNA